MKSDWIEWHGGDCPVPGDTLVQYRLRGGMETVSAEELDWDWYDDSVDIIAYRIVKE